MLSVIMKMKTNFYTFAFKSMFTGFEYKDGVLISQVIELLLPGIFGHRIILDLDPVPFKDASIGY